MPISNKDKIYSKVTELQNYNSKWRGKWLRNFRLYCYTMNVSLDMIKEGNVLGYYKMLASDYTSSVNENVIASCIDSLTSMIASKMTRPYLSGVNTTYNERQILQQAQQFFDIFIDRENLNEVVTEAFRDSCIFGNGFIFIDGRNKKVMKALPWQVIYRPAEKTYGKITRCLYERKQYPATLLPYKTNAEYVTYSIFYDVLDHQEVHLVNNEIKEILRYNADEVPFIQLNYTNPVYGRDATSVVDLLYGIQMKIHDLYQTFTEAARKNPAQVFLVPKGSDIKATSLTNELGQVLQYNPIEGVNNPVQGFTPNFIGEQYMSTINQLKNDAYELTGVSRLSAQSQNPLGADASGRALQTMNDIESERFEVQQRAVINAYVNVIYKCIECFNPEDLILPEDLNKAPITWEALQKLVNKTKVEFSATAYLSKDPSTKLEQIQSMVSNGWLNNRQAISLLGIPDTESAYSYINCSYNAVQEVINEALYDEDYTIPDYIPIDMLKQEILTTLLSLRAVQNENNMASIERLENLYKEAVKVSNAIMQQQNSQAIESDNAAWENQLNREAQQIVNQAQAQAEANQILGQYNTVGQ